MNLEQLSYTVKSYLLWNIPLRSVNICCCDWSNKKADWSIDEQSQISQESQTKRMVVCVWGGGMEKSGVNQPDKVNKR